MPREDACIPPCKGRLAHESGCLVAGETAGTDAWLKIGSLECRHPDVTAGELFVRGYFEDLANSCAVPCGLLTYVGFPHAPPHADSQVPSRTASERAGKLNSGARMAVNIAGRMMCFGSSPNGTGLSGSSFGGNLKWRELADNGCADVPSKRAA